MASSIPKSNQSEPVNHHLQMQSRFVYLRFFLALLTVGAIAIEPYLSSNVLVLHPTAANRSTYSSQNDVIVHWINQDQSHIRCEIDRWHTHPATCGLTINWSTTSTKEGGNGHPTCSADAIDPDGDGWGWENEQSCMVLTPTLQQESDFSSILQTTPSGKTYIDAGDFDGIEVDLLYEGRADYIRIYLINHNPKHKVDGTLLDEKYMSTIIRTNDLRSGPIFIPFTSFYIDQWWHVVNNAPRTMSQPEFNHLVRLDVDLIEFGVHKVQTNSIKLVGQKISKDTYLSTLILLWAAYLSAELLLRYYLLFRQERVHQFEISNLSGEAKKLEEEKQQLNEMANTDPLTGVFNRSGFHKQLPSLSNLPNNCGIIVMDLDHFKAINDQHGHDVGDAVLKKFALIVSSQIRESDVFARWGGEEFIIYAENQDIAGLRIFAEKVRCSVESDCHISELDLRVTASFGIATSISGDTFDALFKRADRALYSAKTTRNAVSIYD